MASADSTTLLTVLGVPLTVGETRTAIGDIPKLYAALVEIMAGKGSLSDAEVIADDSLAVASLVPGLSNGVAVAKVALALGDLAIKAAIKAGVKVSPDPDPIHDAQTAASDETHGHYAGR